MTQEDDFGHSRALVPVAEVVRPLVTAEEGRRDWDEYIALCNAILAPNDYQAISGKSYKKKSAWRKLAKAFAVSDRIDGYHVERDGKHWPIYAAYTVEAESPSGQTAMGYHEAHVQERCCPAAFGKPCFKKAQRNHSCCASGCDGWEHWSHPGDVPATAHTRAKNRAIADLIGAGEVSAEEMEPSNEQSSPAARPFQPKPAPKTQPPKKQDGPDYSHFWAQVKRDLKLESGTVHAVLNVASLKDWVAAGLTLDQAFVICQEYAGMIKEGWGDKEAIAEIHRKHFEPDGRDDESKEPPMAAP